MDDVYSLWTGRIYRAVLESVATKRRNLELAIARQEAETHEMDGIDEDVLSASVAELESRAAKLEAQIAEAETRMRDLERGFHESCGAALASHTLAELRSAAAWLTRDEQLPILTWAQLEGQLREKRHTKRKEFLLADVQKRFDDASRFAAEHASAAQECQAVAEEMESNAREVEQLEAELRERHQVDPAVFAALRQFPSQATELLAMEFRRKASDARVERDWEVRADVFSELSES